MPARYYPCVAIIDSSSVFFLWFTNDVDRIVFENDRVQTFSSLDDCLAFAASRTFALGDRDVTPFDFDALSGWLQDCEVAPVDPVLLLNFWNLIEDFLRSRKPGAGAQRLGNIALYDKLFWANNLPAITPPGERFDPDWSLEQRREIAFTLASPCSQFRAALQR